MTAAIACWAAYQKSDLFNKAKPCVKSNKNDRNDARAICEAALRPDMHFVPVKTVEQQAVLSLYRIHEVLIGQRTATINQLRGLLSESELSPGFLVTCISQ
ncbi:transposase [Edwardsiella ictaluri]|nr:hypothetical protein B6E78_00890 [Edwardsiella ictaluri]QPW28380.1 transposase [Edwardsiella ictaluri]